MVLALDPMVRTTAHSERLFGALATLWLLASSALLTHAVMLGWFSLYLATHVEFVDWWVEIHAPDRAPPLPAEHRQLCGEMMFGQVALTLAWLVFCAAAAVAWIVVLATPVYRGRRYAA